MHGKINVHHIFKSTKFKYFENFQSVAGPLSDLLPIFSWLSSYNHSFTWSPTNPGTLLSYPHANCTLLRNAAKLASSSGDKAGLTTTSSVLSISAWSDFISSPSFYALFSIFLFIYQINYDKKY